ncbi:alpha/beta fold hydrolase [Phaeobacter marinintestinus]|uniref:alpha/beta fold hydrolase n=1 Tax=Falsiphaeobacter marinintestinus TaxID=1492905 RepID=UPI003CCC5370
MHTETVNLNGHPFFLRHWGDPGKPVLLMLHGFPEYSGAFNDLAPLLSDHFHCVAPDQRGYGQSWSPEGADNYTATELIRDMSALIDHLGAPLTVLGHDWGAAVAYGLAIRCPNQVSRLIIANGVHSVPFQRELAKGGAQSQASQYINVLRKPGSEDDLAADNYAKLMQLFSAHMDLGWMDDTRRKEYEAAWSHDGGRLKTMIHWYRATPLRVADPGQPITDLPDFPVASFTVHCPHLLIWGENDTALLPETTQGLETYAPDLTRITIPDADHWLLHQTPETVARAILDWAETTKE